MNKFPEKPLRRILQLFCQGSQAKAQKSASLILFNILD